LKPAFNLVVACPNHQRLATSSVPTDAFFDTLRDFGIFLQILLGVLAAPPIRIES
jgi:hypothetical protein